MKLLKKTNCLIKIQENIENSLKEKYREKSSFIYNFIIQSFFKRNKKMFLTKFFTKSKK